MTLRHWYGHGIDPLRPPRHPDRHRRVRGDGGDRRAHHPVGRDQREVERDVDRRRRAGHDPVELCASRAPDADRDHDVRPVRDRRERERADDLRRVGEPRRGQEVDDPGRQERQRERDPRGDDREVRQHVRVGAPRLALVPDRVRERRPRHAERRQQQHHRGGDAHADRVEAGLGHVGELHQEEAVREVRDPEEERRRDEGQTEVVHLPQQAAVELQAELLTAVAEQREVDDQRPAEVSDDDPERPFVHPDDEEQRQPDRDEDVREARADEGDRALLDPEERGHLLVVDRGPERDSRRADEVRGVGGPEEERRERIGQRRAAGPARACRRPS